MTQTSRKHIIVMLYKLQEQVLMLPGAWMVTKPTGLPGVTKPDRF